MVEFALVLPILLLVVLATVEFGRLLAIQSSVTLASREAARFGAAVGETGGTAHYADCAGIRGAAKRVGVIAGLADGDIDISYDDGTGGSISASCPPGGDIELADRIIVTVGYNYAPVVPLVPIGGFRMESTTRRTILKDIHIEGTPPPTPIPPDSDAPILAASKQDSLLTDVDGDGFISPGDILEYAVVVSNSSAFDAANVGFEDTPGANTSLVVGSVTTSAGSVVTGNSAGDSIVEVSIGSLPAGSSETVWFQVAIAYPMPNGITQVSNQGLVSATSVSPLGTDDPDTGASGDATVTDVVAAPVLAATKTDSLADDADGNGYPSPGDTVHYSIAINNSGNTGATNVVFTDTPDENSELVTGSVTTNQGTITSGNSGSDTDVEIDVGTISVGTTVVIEFDVTVDNPFPNDVTTIENQGVFSSSELSDVVTDDPDSIPVDDATVTVVSAEPEIAATKTDIWLTDADGSGNVSPGDTLRYDIVIENTGNGPASNVEFRDNLDANTDLVVGSVSTDLGTVTEGNSSGDTRVRVDIGTIDAGDTVTVQFRFRIADPFPDGVTEVSNQGTVLCDELPNEQTDDPDTVASGDPTITDVTAGSPTITATKVDSLHTDANGDGVASPGDTLRYQITIDNSGPGPASGVIFTDTPDGNTTLVVGSVSTSDGSVTMGNTSGDSSVEVNVGAIAAGDSVSIVFDVTVNTPFPSIVVSVANQGTVSSNELPDVLTDDPATGAADDPTETEIIFCGVSISGGTETNYKISWSLLNEGNQDLRLVNLSLSHKYASNGDLYLVALDNTIWEDRVNPKSGNNISIAVGEWIGAVTYRDLYVGDPATTMTFEFEKRNTTTDNMQLSLTFEDTSGGGVCTVTETWTP